MAATLALSGCIWIVPVSESTGEQAVPRSADHPSLSEDGALVAFSSTASDLVAGDGNGVRDVFVRDVVTGEVERVSVDSAGVESDGASSSPRISSDGRYVVFASNATNLAPGTTAGLVELFVRDRVAGTTALVSTGGVAVRGGSTPTEPHFTVSRSGRFVVFVTPVPSTAHLVDLVEGTTEALDAILPGTSALHLDGQKNVPTVSDDGRFVAYTQTGAPDLFTAVPRTAARVYDRLLDEDTFLQGGGLASFAPRIAADGNGVVYENFHEGPWSAPAGPSEWFRSVRYRSLPSSAPVVLYERDMGEPCLAGFHCDLYFHQRSSADIDISADARRVVLPGWSGQIVTWDRDEHAPPAEPRLRVGSTGASGEAAGSSASAPVLSGDGRVLAFTSAATNLVPDGTSFSDVYVRPAVQPEVTAVVPGSVGAGATVEATVEGAGFDPGVVVGVSGVGVRVVQTQRVSSTELTVTLQARADLEPGPRAVLVFNVGPAGAVARGAAGVCEGCLAVG